MNRVRFLFGAAVGGLITGIAGTSILHLGVLGLVLPGARELARGIPGLTGKLILSVCHKTIFGYRLSISQKPPTFLGTTVIVCNHPKLEDIPALTGVLARWGLHPAFVSKVENLEGVIGFFVGKPIKLIGKGLFISQRGGRKAKKTLELGEEQVPESILIFPDQHRPSAEAIKRDQDRFPEAGLKTLCAPRPGGVHAILSGLVLRHQPIRVINVSWHNNGRGEIDVRWEDVTTLFLDVRPDKNEVLDKKTVRESLMGLWRHKDSRQ